MEAGSCYRVKTQYPRISIVIPTFNAGKYLSACLESIRKQNYPNLEVVVVDGLSQDHTLEVAARYRDVVTKLISEADTGQAEAVTKGLSMLTGEIYHWHAADDIVMEGALEHVGSLFMRDPSLDTVVSDGLAFSDIDGRIVNTARCKYISFEQAWLYSGRFQSDCCYWRGSLTAHAIPLNRLYPVTVDEEFFLKIWGASKHHVWTVKRLGAFRVRPGQVSESRDDGDIAHHRLLMRREICSRRKVTRTCYLLQRTRYLPKYLCAILAAGVHKIIEKSSDIRYPALKARQSAWLRQCEASADLV